MKTSPARRAPNARGAVLIEFVICLPILAFVLALTFFFGWALMNQQEVRAAARYTAWRNVRGPADLTGTDLNKNFFNNRGNDVTIGLGAGPDTTLRSYVAAVASGGRNAGVLAEELVLNQFPRGSTADVGGRFPSSVGAFQRFQGSIDSHRARDGVEWRRGQAQCQRTVRDLFLTGLDNMLDGIPVPGKDLGQTMRQLYLAGW